MSLEKQINGFQMNWSDEAEKAIKKVPFFVRKKVRKRVEDEALQNGKTIVTLSEVKATQKRFLSKMGSEIKGYQLDTCFGPGGCPNKIVEGDLLLKKVESLLVKADLKKFLEKTVEGPLKFHHEFRITLSECPNACSQPQIKDIGIIGAAIPETTDNECTFCEVCVDACQEDAVSLDDKTGRPVIDDEVCLFCGKCMDACPESVLVTGRKGYRIQLGGKLGRHPSLARELEGIYTEDETLEIVSQCLSYYKKNSTGGKRFAELLQEDDRLFSILQKARC